MVKCNKDQVERLKKALKREEHPVIRQRIQMVLLREDGKTQPQIVELTGVSLSTVNRAHMAYDNGGRAETKAEWRANTRKYDVERGEGFSRSICQSGRRRRTLELLIPLVFAGDDVARLVDDCRA
jgi:hypothetical protein